MKSSILSSIVLSFSNFKVYMKQLLSIEVGSASNVCFFSFLCFFGFGFKAHMPGKCFIVYKNCIDDWMAPFSLKKHLLLLFWQVFMLGPVPSYEFIYLKLGFSVCKFWPSFG